MIDSRVVALVLLLAVATGILLSRLKDNQQWPW